MNSNRQYQKKISYLLSKKCRKNPHIQCLHLKIDLLKKNLISKKKEKNKKLYKIFNKKINLIDHIFLKIQNELYNLEASQSLLI